MNRLDENLFNYYCDPSLRDAENFDEPALQKLFDEFALTGDSRRRLLDALLDHYTQWSLDAFAVGLHLGLSLCHDIRRRGPQQVQ